MRQRRTAMSSQQSRMLILGVSPIGVINGQPVFPICGADDGGSGGSGGSGSGGSEGGEGAGSEAEPPSDPDARKIWDNKQRILSEKKALKAQYDADKAKWDADQAELEEYRKAKEEAERASKSDLERAQGDANKAAQQNANLTSENQRLKIENAFLRLDPKKHPWVDAGAAYELLNKSALKIGSDGSVEGMDDAIKALKSQYPFLLSKQEKQDGKNDANQNANQQGGSTGGSMNGGNGTRPDQDRRAKLIGKYNL